MILVDGHVLTKNLGDLKVNLKILDYKNYKNYCNNIFLRFIYKINIQISYGRGVSWSKGVVFKKTSSFVFYESERFARQMSKEPWRIFGGNKKLLSLFQYSLFKRTIHVIWCIIKNISQNNLIFHDLKEKRSSYPRLYFLSDEDLLELVSASGRGLEAHLSKLYQGVGSIIKNDNGLTAVVSPEGEVLRLSNPVDLRDPLPQWLSNLEEGMKNSLRQSLEKCLVDSTPDQSSYPTQVK